MFVKVLHPTFHSSVHKTLKYLNTENDSDAENELTGILANKVNLLQVTLLLKKRAIAFYSIDFEV